MVTTSQAIQQQIAQAAADLTKQVAIQNLYAKTGVKGIKSAYTGLGQSLRSNLNEIKSNVASGRRDLGAGYDSAERNISDAKNLVNSLLGGGLASQGATTDLIRLASESKAAEADSIASYNMLGVGHKNAGQMAIGDAAREGVQQQGDLRSQIGAEIGELQRESAKEQAALRVSYAQVLADERYKAQQLALEREKIANEKAAREAALAEAKAKTSYKGKEGMLKWAFENGVGGKSLDAILYAINKSNVLGDPTAAYSHINRITDRTKGPVPFKTLDLDKMSTALDIYFGNYASYQG